MNVLQLLLRPKSAAERYARKKIKWFVAAVAIAGFMFLKILYKIYILTHTQRDINIDTITDIILYLAGCIICIAFANSRWRRAKSILKNN